MGGVPKHLHTITPAPWRLMIRGSRRVRVVMLYGLKVVPEHALLSETDLHAMLSVKAWRVTHTIEL